MQGSAGASCSDRFAALNGHGERYNFFHDERQCSRTVSNVHTSQQPRATSTRGSHEGFMRPVAAETCYTTTLPTDKASCAVTTAGAGVQAHSSGPAQHLRNSFQANCEPKTVGPQPHTHCQCPRSVSTAHTALLRVQNRSCSRRHAAGATAHGLIEQDARLQAGLLHHLEDRIPVARLLDVGVIKQQPTLLVAVHQRRVVVPVVADDTPATSAT